MNATKRWAVEECVDGKWIFVGHSTVSLEYAIDGITKPFYPRSVLRIIEQTLAPIPGLDGATEVVGERVVWESGKGDSK